ncbi:unnamed protein product [Soboliphyme baturini]|uniref:DUF4200 domain-containing protein n=1 Tax=Soboliphyme baturini TaxID=241478 RepID=A0A183IG57_9BILA|nr:unnamed protein product [Soboliphyme baturini]
MNDDDEEDVSVVDMPTDEEAELDPDMRATLEEVEKSLFDITDELAFRQDVEKSNEEKTESLQQQFHVLKKELLNIDMFKQAYNTEIEAAKEYIKDLKESNEKVSEALLYHRHEIRSLKRNNGISRSKIKKYKQRLANSAKMTEEAKTSIQPLVQKSAALCTERENFELVCEVKDTRIELLTKELDALNKEISRLEEEQVNEQLVMEGRYFFARCGSFSDDEAPVIKGEPLSCCYVPSCQTAMSSFLSLNFTACLSPLAACAAFCTPGDDRGGTVLMASIPRGAVEELSDFLATPKSPDTSLTPSTPGTPHTPSIPSPSGTPSASDTSSTSGALSLPSTPATCSIPNTPNAMSTPSTPDVSSPPSEEFDKAINENQDLRQLLLGDQKNVQKETENKDGVLGKLEELRRNAQELEVKLKELKEAQKLEESESDEIEQGCTELCTANIYHYTGKLTEARKSCRELELQVSSLFFECDRLETEAQQATEETR